MHMSFGVAACYRGPGLYDTPTVRDMVRAWVGWFKRYRRVLTADLVHVRRPDGQSIDGIMHVDPRNAAGNIAMAAFFNPTTANLTTTIALPLYYAGVTPGGSVVVSSAEPAGAIYASPQLQLPLTLVANTRSRVLVNMSIAPGSFTMLLVRHQGHS